MSRLRYWPLAGAALAVALTACGGNKKEPVVQSTPPPTCGAQADVAGSAGSPAPSGPLTSSIAGDPPTSQATRRLDRYALALPLAANAKLVARQDVTNATGAQNNAAVAQRFLDSGRETGTQYVIAVDGAPRVQFGINQYATAAGARADYDQIRVKPATADALDLSGLGEAGAGARVMLGSGDAQSLAYQIAFVRCRYVVSMADFAGAASVTPDLAISVARAIDAAIKADPHP